jgi:hypothetical protein
MALGVVEVIDGGDGLVLVIDAVFAVTLTEQERNQDVP